MCSLRFNKHGGVFLVTLVLLATLTLGTDLGQADTLLTWDVTGTTGISGSGVASVLVTGVSGSAMSAGTGTTAGNISGGTTSPANTWNRTYALYTDGASAQTANSFITWTTTVSDTYTLTVTGFTGLTLAKTSTAGPTSAELYYSTDGASFTKVGATFTVTQTLTSSATTFTPATPVVILGVPGGKVVTWRLVGFGAAGRMGVGSAGTDNFSILGTVTGGAAKNLTWPGGSGNWDGANAWLDGSTPSTFASNDNVSINGGVITVPSSGVSAGSMAVGGTDGTSLSGGSITGTTLVKTGTGNLTLGMSNSFTGGANASGGVITLGANGALGTGTLVLDGSSIAVNDSAVNSVTNATSVGNQDASINLASGVSVTWRGQVSALGTAVGGQKGDASSFNILNKTGGGTLIFTNSVGTQMSYDTTTKVISTAGAIQLNIASGGSVIFNGASKTMNLGSGVNTDTYDTNTVPPTPITIYNGMVWDGDFYLQNGTVQINGGNIRGTGKIYVTNTGGTFAQRLNFNSPDIYNDVDVAANSTLTLSSSGASIKLQGLLTGSGIIANTGSGGVVLGNTNPSSFNGSFYVYQSSASSTGGMNVKAQILATATGVFFQGGQSGTPKLTIENSATTSGAVIACPITGPGQLTKAYDGDVVLTAVNTFSGGLVVQDAGTVYVTNVNSLGSGPLVAGSVNSRIGLHSSAPTNEMIVGNGVDTGSAIVKTNYGTVTNVVGNVTNVTTNSTNVTTTLYVMAFAPGTNSDGTPRSIQLNSLVSNAGLLKVSGGGNLYVNNTGNSYTGGTEIGTGAIVITNPAVLSTGPINFGTSTNSYLRFSSFDMALTNLLTVSGVTTNSTSTTKYTANFVVDSGLTATLSNAIRSKAAVGVDQKYGARVEKWGAGTLVLAASNDISESLSVNEGVLNLATNTAVSSATALRFVGGKTLLSHAGTMNAGDLTVEGNAVLDLGSSGGRILRFASLASTFSSNTPVCLTISNTANGSIYFPTNTTPERLQQIKSAENPTYVASLDANGLLTFSPPAPTSAFDAWLTAYPSLTGESAARTADPDHDGMSNQDECAFGTDPTSAGSKTLTAVDTGTSGQVTLKWLQKEGVGYAVKSTTDLSAGFTYAEAGAKPSDPQPAGLPTGYTQHEITIGASGGRKFIRVQATVP